MDPKHAVGAPFSGALFLKRIVRLVPVLNQCSPLPYYLAALLCLSWSLLSADAGPAEQWVWRNPVPQGNSLKGVVYATSRFVAVGMYGTVLTSPDGVSWTNHNAGTTSSFEAIGYGSGKFVAVGESGLIMTSPDALSWTRANSSADQNLNAVAYGNGTFVVVGDEGKILTSPDGSNWTGRTSSEGSGTSLSGITFGDGQFVAVGYDGANGVGAVLTSPDGIHWTSQDAATDNVLSAVVQGNGQFLAPGETGTMLDSQDGISWTNLNPDAAFGNDLSCITYGNGQFVAAGKGGILLESEDGLTWTNTSLGGSNDLGIDAGKDLFAVAYGSGQFVAVGDGGAILTSQNGLSWTARNFGFGTLDSFDAAAYGGGQFAVGGTLGTIVTSPDGGSWTNRDSAGALDISGMVYGDGKFVGVTILGTVVTSPDGVSWSSIDPGAQALLYGVAYGNAQFVAVGFLGAILTSSDGVSWAGHNVDSQYELSGVTYGNGMFVAVGASFLGSAILTSTDGLTWTNRDPGTDAELDGVTYGNGQFVVAGNTVLTSTDGVTWTSRDPGVQDSLKAVAYGNGHYVAVGANGTIVSSPDGVSWSLESSGTEFGLSAVTFGNGTFVVTGDNGTILQSQATTAPSTPAIAISGDMNFGSTSLGSTSTRTLTIANTGNATLTVSDIQFPAGFSGDWSGGTIQAGASQPVNVRFSPQTVTNFGGTITVNSDAVSGGNTIGATGTAQGELITFEEVPDGTLLSNQYAGLGVLFTTVSGDLKVTSSSPSRFVPVSMPEVFGDPSSNAPQTGLVDLVFVAPGSSVRAVSDFVSFYLINAQNFAQGVGAYDATGQLVYTNLFRGNPGSQQLVVIDHPGIARVRINLGQGAVAAAIDNLAFLSPAPLPDLAVQNLVAPASADFGQTINVSWVVTNLGAAPALAAWNDEVWLSPQSNSLLGAVSLLTSPAPGPLPSGGSYTNTQSVTLPSAGGLLPGSYYLLVQADGDSVVSEPDKTNNMSSRPLALAGTLLPDFAAGWISLPSQAAPGQTVSVVWGVTNQGAATAQGPWRETVRLVPDGTTVSQYLANPTAYALLGALTASNSLLAGESTSRTQEIVLPLNGAAGSLRLAVSIDTENQVSEANETNNTAFSENAVQVPSILHLNLPTTNIEENASAPELACLVERNGDLAAPAIVSLTSSATSHLQVPTTVTIPAGAPSAPFTATVKDDGIAGPDTWVSISALAGGYTGATGQVLVVNTDLPRLSLTVPTTEVVEGQSVYATVSRGVSDSNPLAVSIISSSSTALSVPLAITIPANSLSVTFPVLASANTTVQAAREVTLSVSATGYTGASTNVTVVDNNTPALTLSIDRTNISESDPAPAATATVTRFPATDQPLTVALASTNPAAVSIPAQVTIPPLQASVSFSVSAVNDTLVTGPRVTSITAQALDALGQPVGSQATETLVVQDDDGPTLQLRLANKTVPKGANPATTAVVWRNTPPTNDLAVTLASDNLAEATTPASVTISAGQTNATFGVASLDDGLTNSSHTVVISASANGYATGRDELLVTDIGEPDLAIENIVAPASASLGQSLSLSFRLLNQGLGPLTNSVTQAVYLTSDPASENRILLGTVPFTGRLAAGQFTDQTLAVPAGALPGSGTYYVVVTADLNGQAAELNEDNNTRVSSSALIVSAGYIATVQAGLKGATAGTQVPLTGTATLLGGGPAANKPVDILVTLRGLERTLSVMTDSNGQFKTVFTPLATEAGRYSVAAVPAGVRSAPTQDQFSLLGAAFHPSSLALNVVTGTHSIGSVSVQNLGELRLTGLNATVQGLAANLTATPALDTNTLPGSGSLGLSVDVSASDASILQSSFTVHVTSAEGVALDLPVSLTVSPVTAQLVTDPPQLSASMLRGGQTVVQFQVINRGGASSGPLSIALPQVPWLSCASVSPLPALGAGETNTVTLVLSPAVDLPLGPYTGALAIDGPGTTLTVPFSFNAVSDAHGTLRIRSTDEFTYFAAGNPPLTNASVTLLDPFSGSVVSTGNTGTNGVLVLTNLSEGAFELDVSADNHATFKGTAVVTAARTNDIEAFLPRQTVRYIWTVVPTQIEDVTHITVQAEFEANVPAPVVVVNPASIDISSLSTPGQFLDVPLTIVNYGLIGVHGVTININSDSTHRFDLVTSDIGDLPAHGSITVPMRVTLLAPSQKSPTPKISSGCGISAGIGYVYLCGQHDVSSGIAIPVVGVTGDCPGNPLPGVSWNFGSGGSTGTGGVSGPASFGSGSGTCNQCMAKALVECAIGFTPAGCPYGVWSCVANVAAQGVNESTSENCVVNAVGCVPGWGTPVACLWSFMRCKCSGSLSSVPSCVLNALGGGGTSLHQKKDDSVGLGLSPVDPMDVAVARCYYQLAFVQMLLGDTDARWFSSGSGSAFEAWFTGFSQAVQPASPSDTLVSPDELSSLVAAPRPDSVSDADVQAAVDRWNRSINNWRAGLYSPTNAPTGANTNFIDLYELAALAKSVSLQYQVVQADGYPDPVTAFFAAYQDAQSKLGSGGTCARIILQLDQDAVLTRDAFKATLQLENDGADPLSDVSVQLVIRNALGQDVSGAFGILPPTLTGALGAVDGTGMLAPSASGSAQWTLVPTEDAAPQAATNYLVSGSFSYTLHGVSITIPLSPAPIHVLPSPRLHITYFHQRDVFADDPYTPEIEPSIPYSLAVMVQNLGYGTARNFHITSAQPKIVDNEKGLLINFQIVGSEVDNQPVSPSLTADFGDIDPGQIRIGRWLLTSTLQGLFLNYKATFQHVDPLGNPRLSLIDGVDIHEMIHLVQAPGAWDDTQPDFLCNDVADFNDFPDTLRLSDGSVQPVSVVQLGTPDAPPSEGHLQVQLTVDCPAGFTYVRIPDPGNGLFTLGAVQDGRGASLSTNDFWTTDRTFVGLGQQPIREHLLHLFDYQTNAGPAVYTLLYVAPASLPDTNPPVSAVFSLPAHSPPNFGVVWSGADYANESGLAYFDVYASVDGGPFTIWQAHTTLTSALYTGQTGHTYAFYSIATDKAGNVETAPALPDTTTTISLSNAPPAISFTGPVTLNEGDTLTVTPAATDPDFPGEALSFKLGPNAPAGATVDSVTGRITWPTTELDGPGTNLLTEIVTDNGFPPLSATGTIQVVVKEVNSAPQLEPIPDYTVNEGEVLGITNIATDFDFPANTLTFNLAPGAPTNAIIDPASGIFTWRPTARQGPSTNRITVIVTDDGTPPMTASQTFTVVVRDVLPDFVLGLGATNLMAGEAGAVPVVLTSSLDLTNLSFQVGPLSGLLTNFTLLDLAPEVVSASLERADSNNSYTANFHLDPALRGAAARPLGNFGFQSVDGTRSAILPLSISNLVGQLSNGMLPARTAATPGQLIIVGAEPVITLSPGPVLTLYGQPGATYAVQYGTNLTSASWLDLFQITLTSRVERVALSPGSDLMGFYRAQELPSFSLGLQLVQPGILRLTVNGQAGANYTVQSSSNLDGSLSWSDLFNLTLTNRYQTFPLTNSGQPSLFFRVKER